jgi:hypothetical protein
MEQYVYHWTAVVVWKHYKNNTSQAYWSTTKLHKRIGLLQNFTSVLVYYKTSHAYWSTTKLHMRIGLQQNFTCVLVYYKTSQAYWSTTKLHMRIGLLQNFTSVLVYYKTSIVTISLITNVLCLSYVFCFRRITYFCYIYIFQFQLSQKQIIEISILEVLYALLTPIY